MSPPIGPKVKSFVPTSAFDRHLKKLDPKIRKELKVLLKEMKAGDYTNGRDIKQIKGTPKNRPKKWQARLNQNYRIRFLFKDGVATLMAVGPHKDFD